MAPFLLRGRRSRQHLASCSSAVRLRDAPGALPWRQRIGSGILCGRVLAWAFPSSIFGRIHRYRESSAARACRPSLGPPSLAGFQVGVHVITSPAGALAVQSWRFSCWQALSRAGEGRAPQRRSLCCPDSTLSKFSSTSRVGQTMLYPACFSRCLALTPGRALKDRYARSLDHRRCAAADVLFFLPPANSHDLSASCHFRSAGF